MQLILFVLGFVFVTGGGAFLWDYIMVLSRYNIVSGKVVAYRKEARARSGGPRLLFYPVVEYVIEGEKRRLISNVANGWPIYNIGESVNVYYSKAYDDDRLKSAASLVMGLIFLIVGGYIFFLIWSIFEISLVFLSISLVIFLMVLGLLLYQLRRRNIRSVTEIKKVVKMYLLRLAREEDTIDEQLITDQELLLNVDLSVNQKRYRVGPFFLFLGVLTIIGSAYLAMEQWTDLQQSKRVEGRVIGYENREASQPLYYPVIVFSTEDDGSEYLFVGQKGNEEKIYAVNQKVPVRYNPDRPADAYLDEGFWNWMGPVVVGLLAMIFLAGGAYITRGWLKIKQFRRMGSQLQARP